MSDKIIPTLKEDMSLARSGNVRMADGNIRQVGRRAAYVIIEEREKTDFYNMPNVSDIMWKTKTDEADLPKAEEEDAENAEPEQFHEEPDGISGGGSGDEADGGAPGFVRVRFNVTDNFKLRTPGTVSKSKSKSESKQSRLTEHSR
jgi:hypothetical protein